MFFYNFIFSVKNIMPRKTFYKRKNRKMNKKKFYRKRKTVNVNKALAPIAQRFITKMKYAEDVSISSTGLYQFNLNSIFDPNRTGIGHQPYGHDQLSPLYNRYRVISCGWRCSAVSSSVPLQLGAIPSNEPIIYTQMDALKEAPRAKYVVQNFGGSTNIISGKVHLPSLVGRTTAQYMADDRYQATVGTSPAEAAVLNIFLANPQGQPIPGTVNVILEYTVEWFDVIPLTQS